MKVPTNGQDEIWTPTVRVYAKGSIEGGRTTGTGSNINWSLGNAGAQFGYQASLRGFHMVPDPTNDALDDCSIGQKNLNQYVITEGIPTSITLSGATAQELTWLSQNSSWTLSEPAPALRSVDEVLINGSSIQPGHFPQAFPTPQPAPAPGAPPNPITPSAPSSGFELDLKTSPNPSTSSNNGWNFPTGNSGFGEKILTHIVNGESYPTRLSLFYPATGFQHPNGGLQVMNITLRIGLWVITLVRFICLG